MENNLVAVIFEYKTNAKKLREVQELAQSTAEKSALEQGMTAGTLAYEYYVEGFVEGFMEGYDEGRYATCKYIIDEGQVSIEECAEYLGQTVEEFEKDMLEKVEKFNSRQN